MKHHSLPQPKILSLLKGTFTIGLDNPIVVPAQANDDVFFAARQLQDEIAQAAYPNVFITQSPMPPNCAIRSICGQEQAAVFGIEPQRPPALIPAVDQVSHQLMRLYDVDVLRPHTEHAFRVRAVASLRPPQRDTHRPGPLRQPMRPLSGRHRLAKEATSRRWRWAVPWTPS
jgi:hypothetical protein